MNERINVKYATTNNSVLPGGSGSHSG